MDAGGRLRRGRRGGTGADRIIRRPRIGDATDEEGLDEHGADDDPASSPSLRFIAAPGPRRVPAPRDLADLVEQHTGVSVADAEIDRSPAVSARAAELGAIVFTEHGTVHLPDELGPLDDPAVRASPPTSSSTSRQQRARGGAPSEDSHEGRELQQQARAVQHRVATDAVRPTFLRRGADAPAQRLGVQRLTSEDPDWVGEDLSEQDYSDVEPRSASDRSPGRSATASRRATGRRAGAGTRRSSRTTATTLQRRRDERYNELLGAGAHGADEIHAARVQLEQEMPYQFGPPFGVAPYPDAAPAVAAAAGPGRRHRSRRSASRRPHRGARRYRSLRS